MKRESIIRAWKDEAYRQSLSEAERAHLPEHPAGSIELNDAALGGVAGGMPPQTSTKCGSSLCTCCCTLRTICPPPR
jgi:mersacidin/lichenicidin family type 2 lantibiotic